MDKNYKSYFLGYFIIFGILITVLSSLISYKIHMIDIEGSVKKYAQEVSISRKNYILQPHIDQMDDIVNSIANDQAMKDFVQTGNLLKKRELQNLFLTLTNSNKAIMQTRFIDANGQEVIRVNRDNGQSLPYIVKESDLQNKKGRDYFQAVSKLNRPVIWHSKLDLNIENGKIEVPYRPTIRIAVPLFNEGKFSGMVICNMLSGELFKSVENSPLFDLFIIDKEGNYILHPDNKFAWNKYTGVKRDLYEDFPEDASSILAGRASGTNFFAYPLNSILNNDDKAILILKPKATMISSLKNTNKIVTVIVALLSLLISIPLAIYAARSPIKLQRALHNSNVELKRFSDIIDRYVISATTKTSGIITSISTAFANISGFSKAELIGEKMNIIRHPDTPKAVFQDLWNTILQGSSWEGEIKNKAKSGDSYWLGQTIIPIKDENGTITSFMSVGTDHTAKKELEAIAMVDKLTHLYNRRKMDECLYIEVEKSKRYSKPLSLIMIDIDYFKKVNDTYGHQTGDAVLQKVAELINNNTRKIDCCARYGGEEFLIMCPETPEEGVLTLAEQIRRTIEAYEFETVKHLTISLGVSTYSETDDMMTLIKKCDEALYKAKHQGRNQVVFYS
ncbi:GGDEF domain-containing protein [Sulfuricurvum sp.]|uniref:sensor domain-containing diguanylate cyclase n=1 Tax=Sulfuricurvum sp. TaxID=2025608 RepID=UPI00260A6E4D|nr:diguanylate cyclase [Sulfuricurvum sp.]MDD2267110.1 diguanylate cyclase [Sulfuricurvum sp.]MDD2782753.1 diguanylate cyclase [Sulfuricurvum sp.]